MLRRACAVSLSLLALLAPFVAGCQAKSSRAQERATPTGLAPTAATAASVTVQTVVKGPTPVMPPTGEGDGEAGHALDAGRAGSPSSSATSTLEASHNPKGSEPERDVAQKCPPGDPLCGLQHQPKGSEPERRADPPLNESNAR